jgi:hypothetical protein
MENQRNGRMLFLALVIAALQATLGANEHHVRHGNSDFSSLLAEYGTSRLNLNT